MIERNRRARVKQYIDELRKLIVPSFRIDKQVAEKLVKADVLDLTIKYLHLCKLLESSFTSHFHAGFKQVVNEVLHFFATSPNIEISFATQVMKKVVLCSNEIEKKISN